MTPIVNIYVEEIISAAIGAGDGGQTTAAAIADAAEKAFIHFKTVAGQDKAKLRALLSEFSLSLTVAGQSGRYSAATRELIGYGVACADTYRQGLA